jgi:hypothetical protein
MRHLRQSSDRTQAFARILGPYLVVMALAAVARANQMQMLMSDFTSSSAWFWVTGAFVVLIGLTVVATHTEWRGLAAGVVSALGWLMTAKGVMLLVFPQQAVAMAEGLLGRDGWWQASMVVMALIGIYLSYVGWSPAGIDTKPLPQQGPHRPDIRHAA